ncbi:MAG: hypothetical protein JWN70_49 [Planctomycetaceae bacterium]|nr:hypothetical protein [Planctomycetaceae bacterium]
MLRTDHRTGWILAVGVILSVIALPAGSPAETALPPPAARTVDFVKDIQPLFAQHCYKCHGPDKQLSGLRLDLKKSALEGGDSGKVVEVKQSAASTLIEYIAGIDPDRVMPPKGERLTAEQVGLVRAWIDQGAVWPDDAPGNLLKKSEHWAFQPVKRSSPPTTPNPGWIKNPIDGFILAKLEREGIAPAPEADRPTLIRRLYLDLLGLIPAPAEIDEFIQDQDPQAYEDLVDRILKSPHFGERWGRHWLDLARYADSDGYEKDTPRPFAYRYRDWVIDAINRDLPFDQFTVEQLAGDLLPNATMEQRMAAGFHRNTLTNKEGGADQEEFRVAATVDRVNTLGSVWLGLTVGCAQCHTHKYDPITQREYFQLFAYLNSIQETEMPAPTPDEATTVAKAKAKFDLEHAPFAAALAKFEQEQLPTRQAAWEQSLAGSSAVDWTVLAPVSVVSQQGVKFTQLPDGSSFASGANPESDLYTITAKTPATAITGFRLEVLPDDKLPAKGPGRTPHGNFVLSEFGVTASTSAAEPGKPVVLKNAQADFEQGNYGKKIAFPISAVLDGKSDTGWAIADKYGVPHVAVFECDTPLTGEQILVFKLDQQHGLKHTIGKFRLSVTSQAPPLKLTPMPDAVIAALKRPSSERTDAHNLDITSYFKTIDPDYSKLQAEAVAHLKTAPLDPATKAQTVNELVTPRATTILVRGDFLRKGDPVQPGTPLVLHALPASSATTRLELAKWMVEPANPLTSRVTVNLWWQYLFGRGLVATVEDFGVRGELPSHPELLDWLASELLAQKWSRKELVKVIVNSATYRQSSRSRPELHERDPKNIWLSHQNRFRLEAEVVRDLNLTASGLLNRRIGGPSVRPPLPPGVAELGYAGSIKWAESTGADKYRRGLYIFFQRTVPYPMLMSFDAPDSNSACVRRERSNTPLQALTLLNDPVFFECAQALGRRAMNEQKSGGQGRINYLFRLCLGRAPTSAETTRLWQLHEELKGQIAAQAGAAEKLAGAKPLPGDELETATSVTLSRILLNLDEFVVRE